MFKLRKNQKQDANYSNSMVQKFFKLSIVIFNLIIFST